MWLRHDRERGQEEDSRRDAIDRGEGRERRSAGGTKGSGEAGEEETLVKPTKLPRRLDSTLDEAENMACLRESESECAAWSGCAEGLNSLSVVVKALLGDRSRDDAANEGGAVEVMVAVLVGFQSVDATIECAKS